MKRLKEGFILRSDYGLHTGKIGSVKKFTNDGLKEGVR